MRALITLSVASQHTDGRRQTTGFPTSLNPFLNPRNVISKLTTLALVKRPTSCCLSRKVGGSNPPTARQLPHLEVLLAANPLPNNDLH